MQIRTLLAACGAMLAAGVAALLSGAHFTDDPHGAAPDLAWLSPLPSEGIASRVTRVSPFGQGPARFEPNRGQAPAGVNWVRRGPSDVVLLGDDSFTTVVRGRFARPFDGVAADTPHSVRVRFAGASAAAVATPEAPLACVTNYLRGPDPSRWIRDLPNFARVRCAEVWPKIDVVFHGRDGRLEYDFLLAPGADPDAIALDVDGAESVRIDAEGDLVLDAGPAEIRHRRPLVWQDTKDGRKSLACAFVLEEGPRVRFRVTGRDPSLPAVIDPLVVISQRFGFSGHDVPAAVATATADGIVVGGITQSFDIVGVGPLAGARAGFSDAFVVRLDPTVPTSATLTATAIDIVGSDGDDGLTDLAVARNGEIFASFYTTDSPTFLRVGGPEIAGLAGLDAALVRFTPDARTPIVAFPFGGGGTDLCTSLALQHGGPSNATVTAAYAGMLSTSEVLPGFDPLATGRNAVVTRHAPDGTQIGAHLVGAPGLSSFTPVALAMDEPNQRLFVAVTGFRDGFSTTPGVVMPTTTAFFPGFVESLPLDLTQRNAATFFTGTAEAQIMSVAAVPGGDVAVTGFLSSGFLPTTPNRAFPAMTSGLRGFLATLSGDLTVARTISDIGGGAGLTYASTILSVSTTSRPELVVIGQSTVLQSVGTGTPREGTSRDVYVAVAPAGGGAAGLVSIEGGTDSDSTNIGSISQRNVEFGRFGALRSDGSVVLAFQTLADGTAYPDLLGPVGGLTDTALVSVTTTLVLSEPPVEPDALLIDVLRGTATLPKKPGTRGKLDFVFTVRDPDGPLNLGLRGHGRLVLDLAAPISPTITASLASLDVPLDAGKLTERGRVSTIRGRAPNGTRYTVVIDGRKKPAQIRVNLTNVPGMFKPAGTPLARTPCVLSATLNGAMGRQLFRATPQSGGRHRFGNWTAGLLSRLTVTPRTVRKGRPNSIRGWFENPGDAPRTLQVGFRHKGVDIFQQMIWLPGRDPVTNLAGTGFATTTAATPGTGLQTWQLLVDGKVVGPTQKTTTTR